MTRLLPALALLSACSSEGKGDEACSADVYGYDCPTAEARAALDRANELRDLAGLGPFLLDPLLDQASQAHADWMAGNGTLDHYEVPGSDGYTGDWVWDRMEAAGYPLEMGHGWSEVVAFGTGPAASVDNWVGSVYHRISFMSPEVEAAGFGINGSYAGMAFVTPYPDSGRAAVLFPGDGQTDVPTSFDSNAEIPDPVEGKGVVGYPISVSVGAATAGADSTNPYSLSLVDAVVTGPDGELELVLLDPSVDEYMFNMVAAVPTSPLQANATYEVELTVNWSGSEETLTGSFTTAP